ncbi:hypothetical protein [Aureivirga marina]|uniref:hypothetical protein n=1 Tax=Aureivirga marina TaxID=1182451 RepID=UPI0018C9C915|nr:hypothetical protein [Aureivirga marina]
MDFSKVKQSEIFYYQAEIFFEAFKDLIKENGDKEFWIKNQGITSRASSRDIDDISVFTYNDNDFVKEGLILHLSRDGIYHQLPEILFHPMNIGSPSMSHREIVNTIKENRKKEKENMNFFIPFDTEIFREKLNLVNRYLHIYTDKYAKNNLYSFAKEMIELDLSLHENAMFKLFQNLCKAEELKENLPELAKLIESILALEVEISYTPHWMHNIPFEAISEGILGVSLGLTGPVKSDQDDILVTIKIPQNYSYKKITESKKLIKQILGFFIFSNRDIQVQVSSNHTDGFELGEQFLGYDSILEQSTKHSHN